ncbi:hypothetical protein [Actinacidiphila sp. bgisy160]|uniref:hypothetical protein n=1 Tax=Actinacidiphila sp. bgisy160 TaxID=3413796 RepID=UPI003D71E5CB
MTRTPTAAQSVALNLIADNPGRVIATLRGEHGYLTINGGTERSLARWGWVARRKITPGTRSIRTDRVTYDRHVWELTLAGYIAINRATERELLADAMGKGHTEEQARDALDFARHHAGRDCTLTYAEMKAIAMGSGPARTAYGVGQRVVSTLHGGFGTVLADVPHATDPTRDMTAVAFDKTGDREVWTTDLRPAVAFERGMLRMCEAAQRCTGGECARLADIPARPGGPDWEPVAYMPRMQQIVRADQVKPGDLVLASWTSDGPDWFVNAYPAAPAPLDPECCAHCRQVSGPAVRLTTPDAPHNPWETCDPWAAADRVLIVPAAARTDALRGA